MAKTTKPVSILVIGMETSSGLTALRAEGHKVDNWDCCNYAGNEIPLHEYDVILGPKCWRYFPDTSDKWIPLILKEARAAQPKRAKKASA